MALRPAKPTLCPCDAPNFRLYWSDVSNEPTLPGAAICTNVAYPENGSINLCCPLGVETRSHDFGSEQRVYPEMTFDMLPNKIVRKPSRLATAVWPDCGKAFELNEFYRLYESSGGEIGEAYIVFWSTKEIEDYEPIRTEMYPATWKIFASDGGGTYFGFCDEAYKPHFFSCDPIDPMGSVTWLGLWPEFIPRLSMANYV